ncbi:hypothetical protein HAZT_HAZT000766 [Hyalella azteca]|uniref:Fibronectin type-III domain-containing protein n=1 Tax=Hyalella azteca TaxID=294128 RepID=A0A6A0H5C7_HYAAZ|nr:hypothetical protein HAZT_HAZT000766 [Hyalella azteca]
MNSSASNLDHITIKRYVTRVPVNITHFVQKMLTPLTWYEIEVTSENRHGASLPPYTLRALTRPEFEPPRRPVANIKLPDVMSCCASKGITHERCLTNLCNPHNDRIAEPDMIVCAPWAQEAFSCLAGDYDHSDCCRQRGLPDVCVELCTGNVQKIDYKYFRCVDYFSDYRGCLLKGYGVLPSSPRNVRVSNIYTTSALLSWSAPVNNSDSVTSFHSYYRPIDPDRSCRGNLCPDTEYEIYIQAFNSHGASDPSSRILFKTLSESALEDRKAEYTYDLTGCCHNVLVSPGCMPLCDYNARMSHVRALTTTCVAELSRVLRCQVGGRNHGPCCQRRGVPESCQSLCTGTFIPDEVVLSKCNAYIGNIVMCLEDGVGLIPGPVSSLHITAVKAEGVTFVWEPPSEGANVTHYQVHYESVDRNSGSVGQFALNKTVNTSDTVAAIKDLDPKLLYKFFVVASNENGVSLPSSVLHLNVSNYLEQVAKGEQDPGNPVAGVPSAPHSLRMESKTATSLTILWEPPELALPIDRFQYVVHHSMVKTPNVSGSGNDNDVTSLTEGFSYNITRTSSTAIKLEDLKPNTQYVIYVTAINDMGESRPSETLLAWTDPAYPAFVEV